MDVDEDVRKTDGKTVEIYMDDIVVKSKRAEDHLRDLEEIFLVLQEHGLKLNVEKCAFGVSSDRFLGHLVTRRGIEADPNQITSLQNLQPPRNIKEVQKLTRMAAALSRFISRSSDKCRPFFNLIKKSSRRNFQWTAKAD